MAVYSTHSTWAKGAEDFAHWLDNNVPGLIYVHGGNLRSSHVSSGTKVPKVEETKTSVIVTYYGNGQAQRLFCHPEKGVTLQLLAKRIRWRIRDKYEEVKSTTGDSPKDAINLPPEILEQMFSKIQVNRGALDDVISSLEEILEALKKLREGEK